MNSVIVSDFGVMLGKTSERLVVRGPRPPSQRPPGWRNVSEKVGESF